MSSDASAALIELRHLTHSGSGRDCSADAQVYIDGLHVGQFRAMAGEGDVAQFCAVEGSADARELIDQAQAYVKSLPAPWGGPQTFYANLTEYLEERFEERAGAQRRGVTS